MARPLIAFNFISSVSVSRLIQSGQAVISPCQPMIPEDTVSLEVIRTTQGYGCGSLSACESAERPGFAVPLLKCLLTPSVRRHLRCPDRKFYKPFSEAETQGISGLLGGPAVPSPMRPAPHPPEFSLCESFIYTGDLVSHSTLPS